MTIVVKSIWWKHFAYLFIFAWSFNWWWNHLLVSFWALNFMRWSFFFVDFDDAWIRINVKELIVYSIRSVFGHTLVTNALPRMRALNLKIKLKNDSKIEILNVGKNCNVLDFGEKMLNFPVSTQKYRCVDLAKKFLARQTRGFWTLAVNFFVNLAEKLCFWLKYKHRRVELTKNHS